MTATLRTQWVLGYAITAGDWLAETASDGTMSIWRVLDATRHPAKRDHVLISGDAGHGVLDAHISDWIRRIIPA